MTDVRLYLLTGPAVAIIVATVFLLAWLYERKHLYTLYLSLSFLAYAVAALSQMLDVPAGIGVNALFSGFIYTLCIGLMAKGVLTRAQKPGPGPVYYLIGAVIMGLLWFFIYVQPALIPRIYAQNFGYGLMLLLAAGAIRVRRGSSAVDKLLFWAVFLFGLHFFVRTALTVPLSDDLAQIDGMYREGVSRQVISDTFVFSPFWQVLNFTILICGFALAIVFLVAMAIDIIDDIRRDSARDTLTGLFNRQRFDAEAELLMKRSDEHPICLVFCDLDHFKSINDTYGHAAGDAVLVGFARLLQGALRRDDIVARFGGEEFLVLLAGTRLEAAATLAERLRAQLADTRFDCLRGQVATGSFGVVEVRASERLEEAMYRADVMSYRAKNSGRNRVCVDDMGQEAPPSGLPFAEAGMPR